MVPGSNKKILLFAAMPLVCSQLMEATGPTATAHKGSGAKSILRASASR